MSFEAVSLFNYHKNMVGCHLLIGKGRQYIIEILFWSSQIYIYFSTVFYFLFLKSWYFLHYSLVSGSSLLKSVFFMIRLYLSYMPARKSKLWDLLIFRQTLCDIYPFSSEHVFLFHSKFFSN